MYPSVTKGEITIEGAQSFYVVNMIGQIVQQVTAANAVNQLFINDLASGLYFIRGVDTEGVVFSVKIVKE